MVEFDIWHVEHEHWVLTRSWQDDRGPWKWAAHVWVRWRGMDDCKAAMWHSQGQFALSCDVTLPHFLNVLSKILKDATLYFSCGTPTLANMIPAMDHINKELAMKSVDLSYDPAIWAALTMAKKTLNRYYDCTDHSEVYRIAMGV